MESKPNNRDTRRRFEQWASNPQCEANTISAVQNVRMSDVATHIGIKPSFGASPFALGRGEQFERAILANGAERLLPELRKVGLIDQGQSGFLDLRTKGNGGSNRSLTDLDQAIEESLEFLTQCGQAHDAEVFQLPAVAAALTVRIPRGVMLPEALLIIDVVTVSAIQTDSGIRAQLSVGEVKTYPDRGGETNRGQLAQARAQLGLYLHALEVIARDVLLEDAPLLSDRGFLILTQPGSDFPKVRTGEHLRYQADRAERGFDRLESLALQLVGNNKDAIDAILHAETHYSEACFEFCDLVPHCQAIAQANQNPAILGDAMVNFLGNIGLKRAIELLEGNPPTDSREAEMIERLRAAEEPGWE